MADRVRMKSKTVMNNPLIVVATPRADKQTVIEGDEFSTTESHAQELEALDYAERIDGTADDMTDAQAKLAGTQTSNSDAITSNRKPSAKPLTTSTAAPAGTVPAATAKPGAAVTEA